MTEQPKGTEEAPRRTFLAAMGALLAGGVAALTPVVPGLAMLLDPLRRGGSEAGLVFVTRLAAIPEDGVPQKFPIVAGRTDAWTTYEDAPVGAVYLRRTGTREVLAFNVVCPHAGCFVAIKNDGSGFGCPCHKSSFAFDGAVDDPASPAPRGLDRLEAEVRNEDEVWVRFVNFQAGVEKQVPLA